MKGFWNRYNFPYSNFHDLNLDWILERMRILLEEWEQMKIDWDTFQKEMKAAWEEYQLKLNEEWEAYKAQLNEEWEAYQNNLNAQWDQMKADWADYKDELNTAWAEYQRLMNEAWAEYQRSLNEQFTTYKNELNLAWENYQTNLNTEWNTYKTDLNAQWDNYQTSLNNEWITYQNNLNTWKDTVDQIVQDKMDEIDEKCEQCKQEVANALTNLNNELANVQQQVTDYLNNLPYNNIISTATNEWLDENGVTISGGSGCVMLEDYGAIGDGMTDDSAAWNAAMTDIVNTGKILVLGRNKVYNVGLFCTVPSYTTIIGNNATLFTDLDVSSYSNISHLQTNRLRLVGTDISARDIKCTSLTNRLGVETIASNNIFLENIIITPGSAIGYNVDLCRLTGIINGISLVTNDVILINAEACPDLTIALPRNQGTRTLINAYSNTNLNIDSKIVVIGDVDPSKLVTAGSSTIKYTALNQV